MRAPEPAQARTDGRTTAKAWLRAQTAIAGPGTRILVGLGLASALLGILQAVLLARLIGPALVGRAPPDLVTIAALILATALARAGLAYANDHQAFQAGVTARRRLRTGMVVAAFARGVQTVAPAGELVTTAVDQVEALDPFFARWLPAATLAWAVPLLVVAGLATADPFAALALGSAGLLVPFGMAVAGIGAAAASRSQFTAMARLQARFLDRVRGIATIVLANQAEAEARHIEDAAADLSRRTMRVLRVAFLSSAFLDAASVAVLVMLAARAGLAWRAGTLHPITAVFGLLLVTEFFAPLRAFAAAYQDRAHAQTAAASLGDLPEPAMAGADAAAVAPAIRTVAASGVSVAFEDVGYTWDASRGPALRNLSFRVPANETALLIGPSGAGKSTVIDLLLGFVQPTQGRVTINGADLATLTPAALSRLTAWIGQRPTLFAGTIRDNIRFGQPDADDAAIEAAARAAGLQSVAELLPRGLDTLIGEGGHGLSGGQAQRVAIARAFVRNAPLLLMDEPTAHLDPATEADVLDSLRRLALGRTVIMAAHSSAAMAFPGRRIFLDHGRAAVEQGAA